MPLQLHETDLKMRKYFLYLATLACAAAHGQDTNKSQNAYVGIGATSVVSLGYAKPVNEQWGVRAEYAFGPKWTYSDKISSGSADVSLTSNRLGLFADWFPFNNAFRLVGGLTLNDLNLDVNATSSASNTVKINNKSVSLANETFNAKLTFPSATPYIGVGLGHSPKKEAGLGFHADLGLMVGSFSSTINTSVLNKNIGGVTVTQADIDKETQSVKDAISSIGVFPSLSVGLSYRF